MLWRCRFRRQRSIRSSPGEIAPDIDEIPRRIRVDQPRDVIASDLDADSRRPPLVRARLRRDAADSTAYTVLRMVGAALRVHTRNAQRRGGIQWTANNRCQPNDLA
jgi:hypothetical protein